MTTDSTDHAEASPAPVSISPIAPPDTCPPQVWSGPICPSCHREEFRFSNGVCVYCDKNREMAKEQAGASKRELRYVGMLLSRGLITLGQARRGEY